MKLAKMFRFKFISSVLPTHMHVCMHTHMHACMHIYMCTPKQLVKELTLSYSITTSVLSPLFQVLY